MKMTFKPMPYVFVFMISLLSCNNEELFVEPAADVVVDDTDTTTTDDNTPVEDTNANSGDVDTSLPCSFTLDNVQAGDTVVIDCQMDLGGQTINLPANVTIVYEGGDIVNGTLNFSDNSVISGELLNSSLTLGGSTPQMKDTTFQFDPQRWGIVEGETTSEIALRNRDILEGMFEQTKAMGITTFHIDKMDAYFEVSKVTSGTTNQNFYPSVESINVPSDMVFEMTENTFLRVQPNGRKNYALLAVKDVSNVTIKGGNLYGDRDKHDDDLEEGLDAYGHVLFIHGSRNIEIDGLIIKNGTGDGIDINSIGFTFQPDYIPANNIRIKNCVLDNNRRNNMSITDGFNMLIEGNTFLNAGIDNANSLGTAPGLGIDIEALRSKDADGNYIYYEKAYDIVIRNNIERGSKKSAFRVAIGDDVTIENNVTEGTISIGAGSGVIIRGNVITANPNDTIGAGIVTGHPDSTTTFNNEISGNTVIGYNIGISAYQRDTEIFDNILIDFGVGIQPKDVKNMNIYRNKFDSNRDGSIAVFGNITSMNNVNIYENEIVNVDREGIKMVMVNKNIEDINNKVVINNNTFNESSITFSNSYGLDFNNNNAKEGVVLINAENLNISQNTIYSGNQDAIRILEGCKDINVTKNSITVTGNNDCVTQSPDGINITVSENTCN